MVGAIASAVLPCRDAQARIPAPAVRSAAAAKAAAKRGDYEESLDYWITAFDMSGEPRFLVGAASVEVTLGRYEHAYKRLLSAAAHRKTGRPARRAINRQLDRLEPRYQAAIAQRKVAERARQAAQEEAQRRERDALQIAAAKRRENVLEQARADVDRRAVAAKARRRHERAEESAARLHAEREWKALAGWPSLGGGAAIAVGSAWWFAAYRSGQQQLDDELGGENAAGRFETIDYASYRARQEALNRDAAAATIGAVVGSVAVTVGAFFLLSRPSEPTAAYAPSYAPAPGGGLLLVHGTF